MKNWRRILACLLTVALLAAFAAVPAAAKEQPTPEQATETVQGDMLPEQGGGLLPGGDDLPELPQPPQTGVQPGAEEADEADKATGESDGDGEGTDGPAEAGSASSNPAASGTSGSEAPARGARALDTPMAASTVVFEAGDRDALVALFNERVTDPEISYKLGADFTIKASELSMQHFAKESTNFAYGAIWASNFDGQGHTITIEVDTADGARPLMYDVNANNAGNSTPKPTFNSSIDIKNLTLHYVPGTDASGTTYPADVSRSVMFIGMAENTHFSNLDIQVDGDIFADYYQGAINRGWYEASGFGSWSNNCTYTGISLKAGVVGYTAKTEALRQAGPSLNDTCRAFGFLGVTFDTGISNVAVEATGVHAVGNRTAMAAGFASQLTQTLGKTGAKSDNINLHYTGDIYAEQQWDGQEHYMGAYGMAQKIHVLTNSTLTVDGSIRAVNTALGGNAGMRITRALGLGFIEELGSTPTVQVYGNKLTVGGDVSAIGNGRTNASGAYMTDSYSKSTVYTSGHTIHIGGSVTATDLGKSSEDYPHESGSHVFASGFAHNYSVYLSSSNDHVTVDGDIVASTGSSYPAHAIGFVEQVASTENSSITVGGNITATGTKTAAWATGFTVGYGSGVVLKNNRVHVGGSITATGVDITLNIQGRPLRFPTYAAGFMGNTLSGGAGVAPKLMNCASHVGGDVTAAGKGPLYAGGFGIGVATSGTGAEVERCLSVVEGNVQAQGDNSISAADAGGFMCRVWSGKLTQNASWVGGEVAAGGTVNATRQALFGTYLGDTATIDENAVFGAPGIAEAAPHRFFIAAPSNCFSTVGDNYYVAMLGSQRISHLLTFSSETGRFTLDGSGVPYPVATVERDVTNYSYTDAMADAQLAAFSANPAAVSATGSGNEVDFTHEPSKGDVAVYAEAGGKTVIRDILGTTATAPALSGNLFYDYDDDGALGEEDRAAAGIAVEVWVNDVRVGSARTDDDGDYTLEMPLASALLEDYELRFTVPAHHTVSDNAANRFGADGSLALPSLAYVGDHTGNNGILVPRVYTVAFHTGGGSAITAQNVPYGGTATRPADPTKDGSGFEGWFTDQECTIPYDFATPVQGNFELYAKWGVQAASSSRPATSSSKPASSSRPASSSGGGGRPLPVSSSTPATPPPSPTPPPASSAAPRPPAPRPPASISRAASAAQSVVASSAAERAASSASVAASAVQSAAPSAPVSLESLPTTAPETTGVGDGRVPLMAPMTGSYWALVNLILTIVSVLLALLMVLGLVRDKRDDAHKGRRTVLRIVALVLAALALVVLLLTENFANPMALLDGYSLLMLLFPVAQLLCVLFARRGSTDEPEEYGDDAPMGA